MSKPTIAVGIITRNEEAWLEGCLKCVAGWADEIIVIDAFSQDRTVEIARQYTDKVFQHEWDTFKNQKNRLLEHVTADWLYACDADERVTVELREEILARVADPGQYVAFYVPTRNVFLGQEMHYGGWSPEYHVRLFLVKQFKGWEKDIHEIPVVDGAIGHLKNGFLHFSHRTIGEMVAKTLHYSLIEAQWRHEAKYPPVTLSTLFKEMGRIVYSRGLRHQAYRDGLVGWIELIYQTFSHFLTYARLWELQRRESLKSTYERLDHEVQSTHG